MTFFRRGGTLSGTGRREAGSGFVVAPVPILLPALAGLLLVLAFPKTEWTLLAWFAPAIWFVSLLQPRGRRPIRSGLGFGLIFFGALLYWTVPALQQHGGLNLAMSVAAFALLVLYLSLFSILFAAGIGRVATAHRGAAIVFLPIYWVALEWIRAHLFTGFPWGLLGYALYRRPDSIQIAAWTGVYGVSFLVAAVNALLAGAVVARGGRRALFLAGAAAIAVAVPFGGAAILPPSVDGPLRVALVQGNVRQDRKWEPEDAETILQNYSALTGEAIEADVDLIVWPEAALPYPLGPAPEPGSEPGRDAAVEGSDTLRRRLQILTRDSGAGLLFGAIEYRDGQGGRVAVNSAQYLDAVGGWNRPYDKAQLVPFVEYIPLRRVLFFLNRLARGTIADFQPGAGAILHRINGTDFATAICYEMIFPHRIRDYTRTGARFLVNITNDGWFGETAGPYQHFAMSVFRAVENRRWVLRAANTGISGFIDPAGRIVRATGLHERRLLVGGIRPLSVPTLYQRIGDAFAAACGIMTLVFLLAAGRFRSGRPG